MKHLSIAALLTLGLSSAAHAQMASWVTPLEVSNMKIVGHSDLNGKGNGGEGLALTQYRDGRRVLFLAHESAPTCFSVVDVTDTAKPAVITQVDTVTSDIRCNSLALSGTTLVVAHQTAKIGLPNAGMRVFDVADPAHPKELAFFDTSGPHSRGVHYVSSFDGRYVYLATGARDFEPIDKLDDQFLMIVDMKNPRQPKEVGRWWMPGTRKGDTAPPVPRLKIDSGYRAPCAFDSRCRFSIVARAERYPLCASRASTSARPLWAVAGSSCRRSSGTGRRSS